MKFAHLGDCHLGGWRQPELSDLNFQYFQEAIKRCIKNKLDFILISGDLFDSPYPSIETLKDSFAEFKKLKDAKIPVFLIAGSHDYSISGKTFLEVLESSGFCKNVSSYEERENSIILTPTIHKNIAIYGYPGRKSGLEVDEIERIKLDDAPGLFKILMLHTTIRDAIGNLPVKAVDETKLPKVDYLALSHLHIIYKKDNRVYSGPIFPNNISELEELQGGTFYIFDNGKITREDIKLKDIISIHLEINNSMNAIDETLELLKTHILKDKIIIIRFSGILEKGSISDLDFTRIEAFLRTKKSYAFLKSTTKLHMPSQDVKIEKIDSGNLESHIIKQFQEKNPSVFNSLIPQLIRSLAIEKNEDETNSVFEERIMSETKRIVQI